MLFKKYHIVIFKERSGTSRNLRLRGWLGVCIFMIIAGLIAGNIWFWEQYEENQTLITKLAEAERSIESQQNLLTTISGQLLELQGDLSRVQRFDSKLRLMMNMERDSDALSVGGSRGEDFSRTYLPMHRQELMVRKMNSFLKQLSEEIQLEEVKQQDLLLSLRSNRDILASLPSIWPVEGFLTSRFGSRPSPFTGRSDYHKGLDISARQGTPIYSPGKGSISFAGQDGAYGNSVLIQHGNGLMTRYSHMQRFIVKEGQTLQRGELIGYVGSTGRSTGPHLHYEVKLNGVNVDPMRYILN